MKMKERYLLLSAIQNNFIKDYEEISEKFPQEGRIELADHFLVCLNLIKEYSLNPTPENWKKYIDKEDAFLLKWKSKLKLYKEKYIHKYFDFKHVIGEKGNLSSEEYNALNEGEHVLEDKEIEQF